MSKCVNEFVGEPDESNYSFTDQISVTHSLTHYTHLLTHSHSLTYSLRPFKLDSGAKLDAGTRHCTSYCTSHSTNFVLSQY